MQQLSYVTLNDADLFMRYHSLKSKWMLASADMKIGALAQATQDIDALALKGVRATADQALRFPRLGQVAVPEDVRRATILIAVARISGVDPEREYNLLSTVQRTYAGLTTIKDTAMAEGHRVAGLASIDAYKLLVKYLAPSTEINLNRNS